MADRYLFGISLFIILVLMPSSYAQTEGFTVTSVSTTSVISKNTDPTTVFWIINVQLNGGGQAISGTISPETIKGFMDGDAFSIFQEKASLDHSGNISGNGICGA